MLGPSSPPATHWSLRLVVECRARSHCFPVACAAASAPSQRIDGRERRFWNAFAFNRAFVKQMRRQWNVIGSVVTAPDIPQRVGCPAWLPGSGQCPQDIAYSASFRSGIFPIRQDGCAPTVSSECYYEFQYLRGNWYAEPVQLAFIRNMSLSHRAGIKFERCSHAPGCNYPTSSAVAVIHHAKHASVMRLAHHLFGY